VQENNKRAGAENLIGIIGMGVAAEFAQRDMEKRISQSKKLKEMLLTELPNYIEEYLINGHPEQSLPNLVSVSIKYVEGESVVLMLDEENIAVSTRSACAAGALQASQDNTEEDITRFLSVLKDAVKTLRDISPLYKKAAQA
jgi:cysteine desulfurase